MSRSRPRAHVHVDGFNLFLGMLKGHPTCKWLDPKALAQRLFPNYDVSLVRYFTAPIISPAHDPSRSQRQNIYLRALRSSGVRTHMGQFRSKIARGWLLDANDQPTKQMERVLTREEKGSDVNIATYLLLDAFGKKYDAAILISNDSDLLEPVRWVRQRFGFAVDVLNPNVGKTQFARIALSCAVLTLADIRACQFPAAMHDARGLITRPSEW
jgi:uncharacterized LabA/DUF88 family protein